MAEAPSKGPKEEGPTLVRLIEGAGGTAGTRLRELEAVAGSIQRRRFEEKLSDTPLLTRSTALWTIMQLDSSIKAALEQSGLDHQALGTVMSIRYLESSGETYATGLHPDFAGAMRAYLRTRREATPVDLPDVGLAILRSGRDEPGGLLPSRLGRLSVDMDAAMGRMELLAAPAAAIPLEDGEDFSESLRRVRERLGGRTVVVPSEIAAELQRLHPEYAGGAFGRAVFPPSLGRRAPLDEWFALVHALYDLEAVAASRHRLIDGQLFLLGLTALDEPFYEHMFRLEVLARLSREVAVHPRSLTLDAETSGVEPEPSPPPLDLGPLAGGIDADRVDPNLGIPLDRDQLGAAPYVRMLASVITDATTPMPLSIGIFGEWGSGKSYFMGLLREQIKVLTKSENPIYHKDVVQIGFNAWHYADSNLWASLGDEIFRELVGPEENAKDRQKRIRQELGAMLEQRKDLEAATEQARLEATRLRTQLDQASSVRDSKATDLLRALRDSPQVRDRMKKVWSRLGLRDEMEQARLLSEHLRGAATEGRAIRGFFGDRLGRRVAWVAAVVLAVLAVAAVFSSRLEWLVKGGAAALATVLAAAIALAARVQSGLGLLRSVTDELRAGAARAQAEREDHELAPLISALREAEAEQEIAESQLAQVVVRVGELGHELAELAPGRRLYSFLSDRVAAGDYSRNLGLVSTIRKDFEHLIELMADWRERTRNEEEEAPTPIDRIVLYIDDLDRCSPAQVVNVLQAVHLLLALDLFVVVVGVDPRWLLRSLQRQYPTMLDAPADGNPDHDAWAVSPEDYLEKIFNIPLVLPGLSPGSFERILRGIVAEQEDVRLQLLVPSADDETDSSLSNQPHVTPVDDGSSAPPKDPAVIPVEAGSELATQQGDGPAAPPRPLTEPEVTLLAALESLIQSPREAKRLLNLYRMLRSTPDLSDASRFIGDDGRPGEFQAVIVLLGLLTAHARLLGQVLDTLPRDDPKVLGGLVHRPPTERWSRFIQGLEPRRAGDRWVNEIVGDIPSSDVGHWRQLATGLQQASAEVKLTDLTAFQTWVPRIRRFSFVLSPLAAPNAQQHP